MAGFRQAWQRSCAAVSKPENFGLKKEELRQIKQRLCAENIPEGLAGLRAWLERNFLALPYDQLIWVTGYYEPVLNGSTTRSSAYPTPILMPPKDLRQKLASQEPYLDRTTIENGALREQGLELAWVDPVDAFFLHIQGSGQISLDGRSPVRFGYAGNNGHAYHAISSDLIELDAIQRADMSMQAIRAWLRDNPAGAATIMQRNKRYIFFRRLDTDGPVGALGVVLTPGRSIAAAPEMQTGLPVWLETGRGLNGKGLVMRRLVMVQDKGGAIRGLRLDYFWGSGEQAGEMAGRMDTSGSMTILFPREYVNAIHKR